MYRTIYLLLDPRDNSVRYVGVTAGLLSQRLGKHVNDRRLPTGKGRWIAELYDLGLRPRMESVEIVAEDWMQREKLAIAKYRAAGCDLLNISDGGYGHSGVRHTKKTKLVISAKKKGRPFVARDPAARQAKISASLRGKPRPPESVEKVRLAMTGRITTPDHRLRMVRQLFAAGRSRNAISKEIRMDYRTVRRIINMQDT